MQLHFNFVYKGHNYFIEFFPCEYMATVTKDTGKISRDILFNKQLRFCDFLAKLEKINFCG